MPVILDSVSADSTVGTSSYTVKICVDGDTFHVSNDSIQLAYTELTKVDSILPSMITGSSDSTVVITWTDVTTYGEVIEVIDVLKKNGIRKYALTKE